MPYPWVNTLLLAFVSLALLSGYFGLTNGDPGRAWILWLHAAVAYAILALLAWKSAVVLQSVRRNRVLGTPRMAFAVMAALLLFVLSSGLVWSNAGRIIFGQVSLIEMHQVAAAILALLLLWHVLSRRWVLRQASARDRRAFLRLAAGAAAGVALWQASSAAARLASLPGTKQRFTGSYETGSFTGRFPRVSWLFDDPEPIAPGGWHLTIGGAVGRETALRLDELTALRPAKLEATLDCTGGWFTTQEWYGIRLREVLELAAPMDGWRSVEVESLTGYSRRFSRREAETALLAFGAPAGP